MRPVRTAAMGVVVALSAAAAAQEPIPIEATLRDARALVDKGRPEDAVKMLGAPAADADPRLVELLGVALFHANEPRRAVETLGPVVSKLAPGSLERREATQVLGLANFVAGNLAAAIPFLEETQAFAPGNPELSYALGMAYVQTRQPEKARAAWGRAFGHPPDSAAASLASAQMMIRAGLDDLAEPELKLALSKDSKLPQARFLLGQSALFRGRTDEAVALLTEELKLNPGNPLAMDRLGDAYLRQGRYDESIATLQRSLWLNPFSSGPYILLGRAYLKKENPAAAEGMLRKAIEYDPNNKPAHYLRAQSLQQMGRAEEAKREFETAERLKDPVAR